MTSWVQAGLECWDPSITSWTVRGLITTPGPSSLSCGVQLAEKVDILMINR